MQRKPNIATYILWAIFLFFIFGTFFTLNLLKLDQTLSGNPFLSGYQDYSFASELPAAGYLTFLFILPLVLAVYNAHKQYLRQIFNKKSLFSLFLVWYLILTIISIGYVLLLSGCEGLECIGIPFYILLYNFISLIVGITLAIALGTILRKLISPPEPSDTSQKRSVFILGFISVTFLILLMIYIPFFARSYSSCFTEFPQIKLLNGNILDGSGLGYFPETPPRSQVLCLVNKNFLASKASSANNQSMPNIDYCSQISSLGNEDTSATSRRDGCYGLSTRYTGNLEFCEKIIDKEIKNTCYASGAGHLNDSQGLEICDGIPAGNTRQSCFDSFSSAIYEKAQNEKNSDLCEELSNNPLRKRDTCYERVSQIVTDEALCEKIESDTWRDKCYLNVSKATGGASCEKISAKSTFLKESCPLQSGQIEPWEPPDAPINFSASVVNSSQLQIDFVWTDTAIDEIGFSIELGNDGTIFNQVQDVYTPLAGTGISGKTSISIITPQSGTHFARMRAIYQSSYSEYSHIIKIILP